MIGMSSLQFVDLHSYIGSSVLTFAHDDHTTCEAGAPSVTLKMDYVGAAELIACTLSTSDVSADLPSHVCQ